LSGTHAKQKSTASILGEKQNATGLAQQHIQRAVLLHPAQDVGGWADACRCVAIVVPGRPPPGNNRPALLLFVCRGQCGAPGRRGTRRQRFRVLVQELARGGQLPRQHRDRLLCQSPQAGLAAGGRQQRSVNGKFALLQADAEVLQEHPIEVLAVQRAQASDDRAVLAAGPRRQWHLRAQGQQRKPLLRLVPSLHQLLAECANTGRAAAL